MKSRILWLSRHDPLPDQHQELERIFGSYELITHAKSVKTANEVVELMEEYDVDDVFVVLPFDMVADLVNLDVKPIKAQMHRTIHSDGEVEFVHDNFYRVTEVSMKKVVL